ncbi:MAG: hypothetical protein ACREX8_06670 [Gammaproteobacteria bacterium]
MSTWEDDLVTRVTAADSIRTLGVEDEVGWVERRKAGRLPAITLQKIAPGRDYNHGGANAQQEPRVQFNIWGTSPAQVERIEAALIALLAAAATVGSTSFGRAFLEGSPDLPPDDLAGGGRAFRRAPDFTLWHEPA